MVLYAAAEPPGPQQRQAKQELMHHFARQYAGLRSSWGNWPGYDRWVARVNNASLAVLAEYEDLAPAFERLYAQQGSWPAFYDEVRRLARLTKQERHHALRQLLGP
jgi:predicted aminopeptidase